jgi:hypothetical protein
MTTETHYDLNIYVGDYNTLSVCAYELEYSTIGNLQTNSSKWLTFDIPMSYKNNTLVGALLEQEMWDREVWLDHDAWDDKAFVINAIEKAMKAEEELAVDLLMWLEALPEYEPVDNRQGEYKEVDPWRDAVASADAMYTHKVGQLVAEVLVGAKTAGAQIDSEFVTKVLELGNLAMPSTLDEGKPFIAGDSNA